MRARLSTERWREVIPHLDRALELAAGDRAAWIAALRDEDAALAADVEALLERHQALEEAGFLSDMPMPSSWSSLAGQAIGPSRCAPPSARAAWAACGWPSGPMAASSARWR